MAEEKPQEIESRAIVCDNGSGLVKVRRVSILFQVFYDLARKFI